MLLRVHEDVLQPACATAAGRLALLPGLRPVLSLLTTVAARGRVPPSARRCGHGRPRLGPDLPFQALRARRRDPCPAPPQPEAPSNVAFVLAPTGVHVPVV